MVGQVGRVSVGAVAANPHALFGNGGGQGTARPARRWAKVNCHRWSIGLRGRDQRIREGAKKWEGILPAGDGLHPNWDGPAGSGSIYICSTVSMPSVSSPSFKTRAVRSHKASREVRVAGSSAFNTGQFS